MEKDQSTRGGEPIPFEQHAHDALVALPRVGPSHLLPALAIQEALRASRSRAFDLLRRTQEDDSDRSMRRMHDRLDVAPIEALDDDLLGMIRALAGEDAREERRLIEGCKRSASLRDWVRKPVGLSLSVPAPDFHRNNAGQHETAEPPTRGMAAPANDANDRDPTAS